MEAHKNTKETWNLINEVINKRKSKTMLPETFNQEDLKHQTQLKYSCSRAFQ